jgi:putative transposase
MGRPYSMDLRERAVRAVEVDGLSRHAAAARFGLGVSPVINWVRRRRATGSLGPGQMGGHKPRKIAGEHRLWRVACCREQAFTLRGLVAELGEGGLAVDDRPVWEFVHAETLSYKKNAGRQRTGPPRCRATARAMAEIPAARRPVAAGLHR